MEDRTHKHHRTHINSDVIFELTVLYITNSHDRQSISLVCKRWYELDSLTHKHITIALCYSTTPEQLRRRFP
ncbi:hypothetical protein Hanom_Chr05g00391301 [Helianthus anomalus]